MLCMKKKDREIKICMDPKDLNENIKCEHYQITKCTAIIVSWPDLSMEYGWSMCLC